MKILQLALTILCAGSLVACRSHVIEVKLLNTSALPVSTIVVDYPGGTFGVNSLDSGKTYVYKIKPLETGPLKIQFTDALGAVHSSIWPSLHKNQEGNIEVRLSQHSAAMVPSLK